MRWKARREAARAVLEGTACIHPASVHDPVSVRIAEGLGFELGMFAGSVGSLTVLGAPDLIVLTLTEFAEQSLRINRAASRLPLVVDADHGYGNALNVMRTVEELEIAGVSAMSIEDTELPNPYGTSKPRLITLDEGVGKIRAALAARQDKGLSIFARTGAVSVNGLEDALVRAKAYCKTGADGLFLTGVTKRAELDAIAEVATIPIILGTLSPEITDRDYLASRGVRIALQGHLPFQAAIQALHATMKALRDGVAPKDVGGMPDAALGKAVTREADYAAWAKGYLGA
ncbi:isocitrate lyase/PEP mutase family protein [Rhodovarius crocodyli]|uniref:Isocitrate lyase/PEP mutase family protein n=1 Tax=Rhodovarius crocodyli TaxID=1979269 RepID=A0A437MCE1_9PROT|nr:isocitrate lyase/PEP mutase family protein [Rhodovarius crocodyli]RVT95310.1 isocitrate lyase/PEP mutase family protein [Rhodovarius crocodyli]